MKQFHITWFDNLQDYHSKGETFDSYSVSSAISQFETKYPDGIFLSCVSMEVLNLKKGMQPVSQG